MKTRLAACVLALLPGLLWAVEEPAEYRMDEFRAPVPATLAGGHVVGPEEAHQLWASGSVAFIDVLPQAPKPAGLPKGTIWRDKKRNSIPGALWLPNVGYGALAESYHSYFRQGLAKATNGNMAHPVLFFCLEDCWMSWNAAKRALEYGYVTVYWLPEGTDGWALWDYPLEEAKPEPEPAAAQ
ncbi:PQQ-dependent catabolism-associated CXXCW motif protein [Puniceibacterium sp. IMCC21224]|uniref:PQQ-dependent catabolism-associated CXXCW motif protein n=1 Tax=Puniceibacterium sp. IMCC21224 TaxID=1618204 RepID=UPI00065D6FB0|nr:PQQ-dependent catabolism-associated CXXCW motif protein [Puniceibacterium sp. IMCC21224]KMK65479.1 PQQ-dependent catabolism-associated CXXCW motif protein [Puniceibacterium sp. IMCC21224]